MFFDSEAKKLEKKLDKIDSNYENSVAKLINHYIATPIRNPIINYKRPGETEIDMVFVSRKGIFVCECMHRNSYMISGALTGKQFILDTYMMPDEYIANPMYHNEAHIKAIKSIISGAKCFNVVITNTRFKITRYGFDYRGPVYYNKNFESPIFFASIPDVGEHYTVDGQYYDNKENVITLRNMIRELPDVYTDREVSKITQILKSNVRSAFEYKEFKNRKKK